MCDDDSAQGMTLNQLRTFAAVAAAGSVRRAAAALFVSAPSVSAAVGALERELGLRLVSGVGRGLELTPAGVVFARYARQVLGLLEEGIAAATAQLHPERGRVRLAAATTAGEHVVPRLLASFRRRYPDTDIILDVGNRSRVWRLLEDRTVDLAIGGRPPLGRFVTLATCANELIVVAAPTGSRNRARRPRPASIEELDRAVWLLREPGSGTRATAEDLFDQLGISPPTLTLGSNGAIAESATLGLGIALLSRDAVARAIEDGSLREWQVPGVPCQRPWHLVTRSTEELPATAALFVGDVVGTGGWDAPLESAR